MSQKLELPDAVYRALEDAARASGTTATDWIAAHLQEATTAKESSGPPNEDWLDHDFLKTYAQEADDSVSLEEVRKAMAKIPGRLAEDIRAEREQR
jgi:DNA-binding GntR family transcriptional regulator